MKAGFPLHQEYLIIVIPGFASLNIGTLCFECCELRGETSMALHRSTLACSGSKTQLVVEVLCIDNLVCGDAVDPPHLHAPYCGRVIVVC